MNSDTSAGETDQPSGMLIRSNDYGQTEFNHRDCGKVWIGRPGDDAPNYCPGCGGKLYDD